MCVSLHNVVALFCLEEVAHMEAFFKLGWGFVTGPGLLITDYKLPLVSWSRGAMRVEEAYNLILPASLS